MELKTSNTQKILRGDGQDGDARRRSNDATGNETDETETPGEGRTVKKK